MEAETRPIKYVFIDIVSYSENRTVEAQTDIIEAMNRLVKSSVEAVMGKREVLYSPTGDGICIALIDGTAPFDAHMQISQRLLETLEDYNRNAASPMRKFQIRIGLNQNEDNLVVDINTNRSVAGAGINIAQRVMSLADAGVLLVSESVYDVLRHRDKYQDAFTAYTAIVKHDVELKVYQYVNDSWIGLNTTAPMALCQREHEIDSKLRHDLARSRSTGGRVKCYRDAREAWQREIEKMEDKPRPFLKKEDVEAYEKILHLAKALLKEYQVFTSTIYGYRHGTMWRPVSAHKKVELEKAFASELYWITETVEEAMQDQNDLDAYLKELNDTPPPPPPPPKPGK